MSKTKTKPKRKTTKVKSPSKRQTEAKLVSLEDLSPADYNPRTMSASAAAGLGTSMQRFGDLSGITWNKRTGNLITGHQRCAQLRTQWGQELTIDGNAIVTPHGDRWPVRVVDWPLSKEKAANVAANNPEIQGDFDDKALQILLAEIKDVDTDLYTGLLLVELETKQKDPEAVDTSPQLGGIEHRVVVTCQDEQMQAELIARLEKEGFECKALMS